MATTHPETNPSDGQLLARYLGGRSPDAFASIVRRHASFVYSVALRQTRDRHLAEDVTQNVFLLLVKKAAALRDHGELSGWLFNATMFETRNLLKSRAREARRVEAHGLEQAKRGETTMQPKPWADVEPYLNDALEDLDDGERQAVMMRYLRKNSYEQVGGALGISPAAARQRVHRGLDRMRGFLKGRGVVVTSIGVLAEGMRLNGVHAAPAELVASTVEAAGQLSANLVGAKTAVAVGTLKAKLVAGALILGSAGVVAGTTAVITRHRGAAHTVYLTPAPAAAVTSPAGSGSRPAGVGGARAAYQIIRAASYDGNRGTRTVGGFVGYINGGDWLRFNGVDLGPAGVGATFTALVACPEQFAGNTLEVRRDSLDGPLLAKLTVKSTGGHIWRPQSAPAVDNPGGVHDLFLRFSGGGWNFDTFNFTPAERRDLGPIDAVGFSEASGVQTRDGVLCEIADGHWARYDGLDFGPDGVNAVAITYACDAARAGGTIALRLDRQDAPPVARMRVEGTGGSRRFLARSVPLAPSVTGRRNVFLTFSGGQSGIANVSRIEFLRGPAAATHPADAPKQE